MARVAFDIGPRYVDQDELAKALNYSGANNGAYSAMRSTAGQFGLLKYEKGYISVSDDWIDAFNSEDAVTLQRIRRRAFLRPDLYAQLVNEYRDKQLPSQDRLTRELYISTKYGILREAAAIAAQVFIESAAYVGALDGKRFIRAVQNLDETTDASISQPIDDETGTRDNVYAQRSTAYVTDPVNSSTIQKGLQSILIQSHLDRIEVKLESGDKALLFIPVPVSQNDKRRLKAYVDLLLEVEPDRSTEIDEL